MVIEINLNGYGGLGTYNVIDVGIDFRGLIYVDVQLKTEETLVGDGIIPIYMDECRLVG